MSKLIKAIASLATSTYYNHIPTHTTFFGTKLNELNQDELEEAIVVAIEHKGFEDFIMFNHDKEELLKELNEKIKKADEEIEKKSQKFTQELTNAQGIFDYNLNCEKVAFEREQEIKKLEMIHNEKMFITEVKNTKTFINTEIENAKTIHTNEIAIQKTAFELELKAANEFSQQTIAHNKAIADATIAKLKEESTIIYTHDIKILEAKIRAEVTSKYQDLLDIASKYGAAQELIARLEEDKAYFQTFAEDRIDRSEEVTNKLIDKIHAKEVATVTVTNISGKVKTKKSIDE